MPDELPCRLQCCQCDWDVSSTGTDTKFMERAADLHEQRTGHQVVDDIAEQGVLIADVKSNLKTKNQIVAMREVVARAVCLMNRATVRETCFFHSKACRSSLFARNREAVAGDFRVL